MRYSLAVAVVPLVMALAPPAMAFDCGRASTIVEKAICAEPALKSLDARMEAAYAEAKSLSSKPEQKMLARSQKAWIAERETGCASAGAGLNSCIGKSTQERLDLLDGRQESGPGSDGRIIPVFIVQAGTETQYELDISLLRFAEPRTAGEKLFNRVAGTIAERVKTGPHGEDTAGHVYVLDEAMTLSYASSSLISVMDSFWSDLGGAHGNGGTLNTNIDMKAGKILEIGDLFPEAAVIQLTGDCKDQLIAEKRSRLSGENYNPAEDSFLRDDVIGEHVATLARWQITEGEASVSFDAYAIGSYAEGSYDCRFAMDDLRARALPGAPLP